MQQFSVKPQIVFVVEETLLSLSTCINIIFKFLIPHSGPITACPVIKICAQCGPHKRAGPQVLIFKMKIVHSSALQKRYF